MITRRTKVQLMVFVADHAARRQLRRRPLRPARPAVRRRQLHRRGPPQGVRRHLRRRRGLLPRRRVGQVGKLELTDEGVDAYLDVENELRHDPGRHAGRGRQPVGGRRAVRRAAAAGRHGKPYLADSSEIAADDTRTPIATQKLLTDISTTPSSRCDQAALQTTVDELGKAFDGTGPDLQRIIDTGNSFIEPANQNFDTTTALIRDGNTVLKRPDRVGDRDQAPSPATCRCSAARWPARDPDLRKVIDNGSATATQLRTFLAGQPGRPRPS